MNTSRHPQFETDSEPTVPFFFFATFPSESTL
jgi:hypothetical protein